MKDVNLDHIMVAPLSNSRPHCSFHFHGHSSDGKFDIFLNKLELIIQKLIVKNRIMILNGGWYINLHYKSTNEGELKNLFLRHNLKNTVNDPIRITKSTSTLCNVIVINVKNPKEPAIVMDLGLSDHYAQVRTISLKNEVICLAFKDASAEE
jgi:hypothetical protein